MKDYLYFPGCSLKGTGGPYERSVLSVFSRLGSQLTEISNWNCCGATAYLSVDSDMATFLATRNLALAEQDGGKDVIAPCSGCYLALSKAKATLAEYPELGAKMKMALREAGLTYEGCVRVRHPLEVLLEDPGLSEIKPHVTRPLRNLRLAPYYGCAVLRPYPAVSDSAAPHGMEDLLKVTEAKVVDYPFKSRCCGGMLTSGVPPVGLRLVEILLDAAKTAEADALVTTCPLCQYNLEFFQDRLRKSTGKTYEIPILYFTQVLGMSLGLPDEALGLDSLLRKPSLVAEVRP